MTQPEQPPTPRPPQPLNYATPQKKTPAGGMPYVGQSAIGCATFWLVMAGLLVVLWVLPTAGDPAVAYLVAMGLALAALATLSVMAWVRWRWPGFLTGVLVGLLMVVLILGGLALLIWSICSGMKI